MALEQAILEPAQHARNAFCRIGAIAYTAQLPLGSEETSRENKERTSADTRNTVNELPTGSLFSGHCE